MERVGHRLAEEARHHPTGHAGQNWYGTIFPSILDLGFEGVERGKTDASVRQDPHKRRLQTVVQSADSFLTDHLFACTDIPRVAVQYVSAKQRWCTRAYRESAHAEI